MRTLPVIVALLAAVLLCLSGAGRAAGLPGDWQPPAPPGPFLRHGAEAPTFASGQPLVATSYFYWYDAERGMHIRNGDGSDALTDHPPALEGFSYRRAAWHRQQLLDMMAAGIDIVLPVYWGYPGAKGHWSNEGLTFLVEAREALTEEGRKPPAIGLFYDTSTLRHNGPRIQVDLTTAAGRRWFFATIRDAFSLIPPKHRACIGGRPIVFLYAAAFAKAVDAELFPATRRRFRESFGCGLFLVKKPEWPGQADSVYQWGGALMPRLLETAALGPGYDHSAVPGRTPLVRTRKGGDFYRWSWEKFLALDPATRASLVHVETWNEFHEGTDVCHSKEYGRQYIELTRKYADLFHRRHRIERPATHTAPKIVIATPAESKGLRILPQPQGDGPVTTGQIAGRKAFATLPNRFSDTMRYLYFDVDLFFACDTDEPMVVTVDYYDAGCEAWTLQYDSAAPALEGIPQRFRTGHRQEVTGTKTWKRVRVRLPHARFAGRANGADFRLAARGGDLHVSRVAVQRPAD
jgi:hypothetical protein